MRRFKRSERVGDLIHHEVSNILLRDIKDPRLDMVSITGAKVSDDLRHAVIFYSVIGGEERWIEVGKGFESSKGFIKRELGKRLKMKYMPDLRFEEDRSLESGNRIDRILESVGKGDVDAGDNRKDR